MLNIHTDHPNSIRFLPALLLVTFLLLLRRWEPNDVLEILFLKQFLEGDSLFRIDSQHLAEHAPQTHGDAVILVLI